MNKPDWRQFATALILFLVNIATAAKEPALAAEPSIEILAATCAGCHGPNGNSEGPATPTISGTSETYFILAMDQYRQGLRNSTIMARIAKGYSWDQIRRLAIYFAQQPMISRRQDFDGTKARRGKRIHASYCEQCHLRGGALAGRAGVLSGQMMPYLRASLNQMMKGERPMPPNMKRLLDRLVRIEGKKAIDDLLNYYASQRTR